MQAQISRQISRMLATIRQAFRGVLGRVNSSGGIQLVSLAGLDGEQLRDNEQFQEYGLTSNPPAGTMAVILPVGGKTSHGIVIATEHATYRLVGLVPGEVALYSDEGSSVVLRRGKIIEVTCDIYQVNCRDYEVNASAGAAFNTPKVAASGEMDAREKITGAGGLAISGGGGAVIEGGVSATEDVVAAGVSLVGHDHDGDSGGVTSPPRS